MSHRIQTFLTAIRAERGASANTVEASWSVPVVPELGVHYSYGCAVPESDGQFSYPNTSCVDNRIPSRFSRTASSICSRR